MKIQKFIINEKEFIGVDEVGRGSLIGPVITCAIYINQDTLAKLQHIPYIINDSKKISKKNRQNIVNWINNNDIKYYIGSASVNEIDELNIREANNLAMNKAIYYLIYNNIEINKSINCYIDGNYFSDKYHLLDNLINITNKPIFKTIIKGDSNNIAIALSSIIAKEYRDELITKLGYQTKYKPYNWSKNMGYGTNEHLKSILKNGITIYHRLSFLKKLINKTNN
jgi:ribonuclease HII